MLFYCNDYFLLHRILIIKTNNMKQIKLFAILMLCTFFLTQTYSQGCYYPASFSYTNNGAGNVSFVNTSTYISASSWDFGDGNISTQNHPTHTYTSNGYYTVTLDLTYVFNMGVYGSFTCYSTTSSNIFINNANSTYGCMDTSACNYNPSATIDDGSCILASTLVTLQMNDSYGDGWNGDTWTATSTSGGATYGPFTLNSGYSGSQSFCLADDCYDITVGGGSYPYETSWSLIDDNGTTLASGGSAYNSGLNIGNSSCAFYGCTDPLADNYDFSATIDDGSCIYCPTYAINEVTPGCPNNNNGTLEVVATSGSILPNTSFSWIEQIYLPPYGSQTNSLPFVGPIASGLGPNYYSVSIMPDNGCPAEYLSHQFNPTWGCTDSLASNYDPSVTCNDGSCTYITSCGLITGVNLTDVIHDRVTLNWDDMNTLSCVVDQIRIRYRELGTSTYSIKTMGAPLGNNNACLDTDKRILNLSPSTQYEYEFKLWYQDGTIKYWHSAGVFTTRDNCPNVGNFTVSTPNTNKARFTWDDSNGNYKFVRIKMIVDSISNPQSTDWFNVGGLGVLYPTFVKDKNGLISGETYRAKARTWCNVNGGPYKSPQWSGLVVWSQPFSARLEGESSISNLDIYPNPSRDIFNVVFTSEDVEDLEVRVINLVGEVVYTEDLQQFIGEYTKKINLKDNAKGIYLLEIETNEAVINKKLILQ